MTNITPLTTIGEVSIELAHVGLEHPGDVQLLHVAGVDLLGGMEALLVVVAVGVQEVGAVAGGLVEHRLRDRRHVRRLGCLGAGVLFDLLGGRSTDCRKRKRKRAQQRAFRMSVMGCLPGALESALRSKGCAPLATGVKAANPAHGTVADESGGARRSRALVRFQQAGVARLSSRARYRSIARPQPKHDTCPARRTSSSSCATSCAMTISAAPATRR